MFEIFIVYMVAAAITFGIAYKETQFSPKNIVVLALAALAALVWPVTWLLFVLDR